MDFNIHFICHFFLTLCQSKNQPAKSSRCSSVKFSKHFNVPPVSLNSHQEKTRQQREPKTTNKLLPEFKIVTVVTSNKATELKSTESKSHSNNTKVTISNSDISRTNQQEKYEYSCFQSTRTTSSISKLKIPIIETTSLKMGVDFTPESQKQHFIHITSIDSRRFSEHKTGNKIEHTNAPIVGDLLSSIGKLERKLKSCQRLVSKKCTS